MPSVISQDGTRIAFDREGQGPPLILVDGAMCYRYSWPSPASGKTDLAALYRVHLRSTWPRAGGSAYVYLLLN